MPSGLIEVPLGLEVAFPGGTVHHNFAGLPGPLLVRTLARAHLSLTNSGGGIKTKNTSQLYANAVRQVAWFFFEQGDTDDLRALDAAGYRHLIAALGSRPLVGAVRALLLRCGDLDPDGLHPGLRPLLTAPSLREWSPSTPIAPLREGDAKRLETACKASIVALEARLAEGTRILADLPDPVALDDQELIERQIIALLAREGLTGSVPQQLRRDRRVRYVQDLTGLLFPTLTDLVPFLLLVGLRTGLNPESLDALAVDAFEDLGTAMCACAGSRLAAAVTRPTRSAAAGNGQPEGYCDARPWPQRARVCSRQRSGTVFGSTAPTRDAGRSEQSAGSCRIVAGSPAPISAAMTANCCASIVASCARPTRSG